MSWRSFSTAWKETCVSFPAGTQVTNPSELLSNGRLKTLLDRVMPVFDWVILDSAPLAACGGFKPARRSR